MIRILRFVSSDIISKDDELTSHLLSTIAPTDASTLIVSNLEQVEELAEEAQEELSDTRSRTSYATSVYDDLKENNLQAPKLKDVSNLFPFECPYCWRMQGNMNKKSWRYERQQSDIFALESSDIATIFPNILC